MLKKYFINYNILILFAAILIGLFLRVYKIESNYYFSGELGKELLYIRQFVIDKSIPMVGMATSHPWLYYGPVYYWLVIPIYIFFNGNPFILFWVALVASITGLALNYWLLTKIADSRLALISTLLQAISPLLIWQTRLSKLHVFFWVLMPVFIYLLFLLWNGKKKWILMSGLVFGLLFSFHFSQIPIIGVLVAMFWIKKEIYKFKNWLMFGLGVIIPNITLLWQDRSLVLWLPYRAVNFANKEVAATFDSLIEYLGKVFFWNQTLWFLSATIFIILFIHYIYSNRKKITTDFLPFYLITSTILIFLANILHGAPPVHYFLPVFTTVPIIFAIYLSKFNFWPLVVLALILINIPAFYNDPLFYKNFRSNLIGTDIVSFATQINAISFIVSDAKEKSFSINRIGPYDYFPDQYSQNYKYLALWRGGNLVDNAANRYTIIEGDEGINVQK